jgi:TonB family protein
MRKRSLIIVLLAAQLAWGRPAHAGDIVRPEDYQKFMIKYVDPEYPAYLYRNGIQGRGIYRININQKTGEVEEVKVVRSAGHRLLNEFVAKAALQWRFIPGRAPSEITFPYEFHIRGYSRLVH